MSVGSMLRQQRQEMGLDLSELSVYLNIRLPYLEAIETDAFDQLPTGNAYRIGFIKSYAAALQLDADKTIDLFRKEQAHTTQRQPLTIRRPISESRVPTFSLIFIVLAVFAAGWVGWAYLHRSDRTLAEEVPPVPERLQPKPVQTEAAADPTAVTAPPTVPTVAAPASSGTAAPAPATGPFVVPAPAQPTDPKAVAPTEAEADEAHDDTMDEPRDFRFSAQPPAASATPGVALGGAGPSRVAIKAVADSWVQILNNDKMVYTGVLHAGDSYRIPDQPGWTMVAGNAGGITLMIDGKFSAPLGPQGAVIRNVKLDPAQAVAH